MKKVICAVLAVLFCGLIFTACNDENITSSADYVSKDGRCVVSLPKDYFIVYENDGENSSPAFDEELYTADTINGQKKKDGYNYFNLLSGEPFRILTPLGIIQDKNAENQTLVYWKLNETLYKDGDNYYSENLFSCVSDTQIDPVYFEFRPVGLILLEINENHTPILTESEIFYADGEIRTQDGVHYLYGVYDFEPQREFWRTNLEISEFNVSYTVKPFAVDFCKREYTIDVKIKKGTLFDKGNIIAETLCKIDGHGYKIKRDAAHILHADTAVNVMLNRIIGSHTIKYSFVE